MNVLILSPRLDVPFKNLGPVPLTRGPIPDIRRHWATAIQRIATEHRRRGDQITIEERPLWEFTSQNIYAEYYDRVYIPHREDSSFNIGESRARYYMQSVFPWIFYVDPKGFAGGSSMYPFPELTENASGGYDLLRASAHSGNTKFEQPDVKFVFPQRYVLFPCQIPHDVTILYHSTYSVQEALRETCEATASLGIPLVVKGHPVNPDSMQLLKEIANKYPHTIWVDHVHIHDAIKGAESVVVVNSGTGMESLLFDKPVITFGRCEYNCVTNRADETPIRELLQDPKFDLERVKLFFDNWYALMYDTRNESAFHKLA